VFGGLPDGLSLPLGSCLRVRSSIITLLPERNKRKKMKKEKETSSGKTIEAAGREEAQADKE